MPTVLEVPGAALAIPAVCVWGGRSIPWVLAQLWAVMVVLGWCLHGALLRQASSGKQEGEKGET